MRLRLCLLLTAFVLLPSAIWAAEPAKRDTPNVPPPPTVRDSGAATEPAEGAIEPEVTITTRGNATYEEYRVNGRLYMVKVTPAKGKPYYLLYDELGRVRRSDLEPSTVVPQWVIKRW